jgi:hypothetical protein
VIDQAGSSGWHQVEVKAVDLAELVPVDLAELVPVEVEPVEPAQLRRWRQATAPRAARVNPSLRDPSGFGG